MTFPRYLLVVTLILLPFAGSASANGSAGGTVNAINVNRSWQGLMVQLNNPLTQNYEAACPLANWAYISIADPWRAIGIGLSKGST